MSALPEWAQKQIKDLRAESANHRKAKSAAEQQAAQAAEQAAKEQGKWQELATTYEPKAKRADELERYIAETLDAELLNVPEKLKGLVPEGMDALGQAALAANGKGRGPVRTAASAAHGRGQRQRAGRCDTAARRAITGTEAGACRALWRARRPAAGHTRSMNYGYHSIN